MPDSWAMVVYVVAIVLLEYMNAAPDVGVQEHATGDRAAIGKVLMLRRRRVCCCCCVPPL